MCRFFCFSLVVMPFVFWAVHADFNMSTPGGHFELLQLYKKTSSDRISPATLRPNASEGKPQP